MEGAFKKMSRGSENEEKLRVADEEGELLDDEFLAKIDRLELVSRKVITGRIRGERLTGKRGQSVEFADYRQYVPGDDLRMIDWNIYGRLDRLFLKLFLEEEDLHVYILVDSSASMGFGKPTKLFYAKRIAAALSYIALSEYDRVILGTFDEGPPVLRSSLRGKRNVMRALDFLARIEPGGGTRADEAMKTFAFTRRRKGVVVVISDFFDKGGYEEPLKYLLAGKHDIFALHVLAPEELEPELSGDLTLVDVEDDDEAEITVSAPLLKRYKQTLSDFVGSLRDYCTGHGISYVLAPTTLPFDTLVVDYLRRRGMVK